MILLRGEVMEIGVGLDYLRPDYATERVAAFQNRKLLASAEMNADGSFELTLPAEIFGVIELRASFPEAAPTEIDLDPEAAEVEVALFVNPEPPRFA